MVDSDLAVRIAERSAWGDAGETELVLKEVNIRGIFQRIAL
jgi:hypothetical protein